MSFRLRLLGMAAAVAGFTAGLWYSVGPPRITLVNAALRVDHDWRFGAAALSATLAAAAFAWLAPRKVVRALAIVAALVSTWRGADLLTSRLETGAETLTSSRWSGRTDIAWRDVQRVDAGPDVVVVWGREDAQVRIATSGFRADQRASLDRAIARRVTAVSDAPTIRRAGADATSPDKPAQN